MILDKPYFLNNKEWYIVNEGLPKYLGGTRERRYSLTDKAPKEAIRSYNKFYKDLSSGGLYIPTKKKRFKLKPLIDDSELYEERNYDDDMSIEEMEKEINNLVDEIHKGATQKMQNDIYEFYKDSPNDKIWKVNHYKLLDKENGFVDGNIDVVIGELLFSFDKKKIYNLWIDYPHNFTKEEKEIFDKEYPYWKNFFKDRRR